MYGFSAHDLDHVQSVHITEREREKKDLAYIS